jgi:hypothetical protein
VAIRKASSPTQPGRGIRKIVDLFHDLPELLDKANRHVVSQKLGPTERAKVESQDFEGKTKEDIEDERQEYVTLPRSCHRDRDSLVATWRSRVDHDTILLVHVTYYTLASSARVPFSLSSLIPL